MSDLAFSLVISSAVGGALSGLSAVQGGVKRLGEAMADVKNRQKRMLAMREDLLKERDHLRADAMGVLAMVGTLALPVKLAVDFESSMADVKKVVDFETPQEFERLSQELLELTRTMPMAATELAQIAASGGQLGVAQKDIKGFTEVVAKMATAFDMSAADAGDSMAKLANVYNIPILQINRLGDAINQLENESPAKASDIVRTLGRIGGVAKQFGLTELQAASLANAFIALGKPPEVAGTAINAMLMKLGTADKQNKRFQQGLDALGVSASDLKKSIGQDAQGALLGFLQTLQKVPAQQRMGVLVDLFGLEYADDVAVLAGSVGEYERSIAAISSGKFAGSMDKEFASRSATTANNFKLLKNGLVEIGINVGSVVLPALNDLVNTLRPVVAQVADFARKNPQLVGSLWKLTAVLVGLKAGSLLASYGLNFALRTVISGVTWFNRFRTVVAWVSPVLGELGGLLLRVGGWMLRLGMTGLRFLVSGFGTLFRVLGPVLTWIGRLVAVIGGPVLAAFALLAFSAYLVYTRWDDMKGGAKALAEDVQSAFGRMVNWFKGLPATFASIGRNLVDGLVNGVTARLSAARNTIVGFGQNIKGWFASTLGIKSPSRVFMAFGGHIADGARLGIDGGAGRVKTAAQRMAKAAAGAAAIGIASGAGAAGGAAGMGGGAAGVTIHFSPVIHAGAGGAQDVLKQIEREALPQLERLLARVLQEQRRRSLQ